MPGNTLITKRCHTPNPKAAPHSKAFTTMSFTTMSNQRGFWPGPSTSAAYSTRTRTYAQCCALVHHHLSQSLPSLKVLIVPQCGAVPVAVYYLVLICETDVCCTYLRLLVEDYVCA